MAESLKVDETTETDEQRPAQRNDAGAADLPFTLPLELTVSDSTTIAELCAFPDGEAREQFALNALRIGVLALQQARGQIDAELIRRESERLMDSLHHRLNDHSRVVHDRLTQSLKEYFDPEDGRFNERVERLVKQDGDLERLLRDQIGSEDSQLTKTLTSHFGEESPLMKILSPDRSKGLLAMLQETLDEKLQAQREHVLTQFSLDNKESALSRFIAELSERQGKISDKLHGKIDEVVKEFSLDDEDSALSRLVKNVDRAQRKITSEFSLDDENSSLARLKRELLTLLKEDRETNQKFQQEVKSALEAMVARKKEADRSTRHGLEFEDAVCAYIEHQSQQCGDIATRTGNTTGRIKNSKVGDCLVELGPESAASGVRVAIEAKEQADYTLARAREEIETARKNRDADVGLFVFSRKTAPEGMDELARYGNDVFIVWDAEDAGTDLFLRVGLTLSRALCVRSHRELENQEVDFDLIDKAVLELEKRTAGLSQVEKWTETIRNNSDKIVKNIQTTRKSLETQIEVLAAGIVNLKRSHSLMQDDSE